MAKIINTKTINGIYYLLYQSDIYKTKSSYVCFGLFSSYELANAEAKKNNLYNCDSSVVIEAVKLNQFAEII